MTIPNPTMVQRCEEIRALLAFERPENPETNEIEWQSFLHRRHDFYTKFPYDSDDEDEDDDTKTQKRQLYSNSDTNPEKNSFLRLTEALPAPVPQAKPIKITHLSSEDPETETETINTRLHTTLTQPSLPIHTLQSSFNSELALLTSRYAEFSLHSSQRKRGEKVPLLVDTGVEKWVLALPYHILLSPAPTLFSASPFPHASSLSSHGITRSWDPGYARAA
ncbi:hypothetical protein BGAL_0817g00020 [Botrytis galanthina]|uniref:Uncharacterized protein n=1 Tax=Botrytis galanthina TaxID=278940 RepID=A0A4S8QGV6_9HELO|nr:hypothetical protein BGAL_0817g00020 [Botrytis galanthina]